MFLVLGNLTLLVVTVTLFLATLRLGRADRPSE